MQDQLFDLATIVEDDDVRGELETYGEWTAIGVTLRGNAATGEPLPFSHVEHAVEVLRGERNKSHVKETTTLWQLGDLLNYAELYHPEEYSQLLTATMYKKESLGNVQRIAEAIEPARRYDPNLVSFWLYGHVYTLPAFEADELLEQFVAEELTYQQVKDEARELREAHEKAEAEQPSIDGLEDDGDGPTDAENGLDDDESDAMPTGSDTCPLCDGAGHVSHDRREAYLREEVGA